MAIFDAILKFQPYETNSCSNLIACIIQPLNIHKKSNLKCFIEWVGHIGLRSLTNGHLGHHH